MADERKRLPGNAPGPLFVDASCIDCDTCRMLDPDTYAEEGGQSVVRAQPGDPAALARALRSLIACPTASIGLRGAENAKDALARARRAFPEPVDAAVYYCGWTSEDSYGASSWLVKRPGGNVLVDSPRFAEPLLEGIRALGGAALMFLTHRDDVADHAKWAKALGLERVLHADEQGADTRDVERVLTGIEPVRLAEDLLAIPTPGHTRGHAVLLHRDEHLFTGDHLAGDGEGGLTAFRGVCWYDWGAQTESMRRLTAHRFRHVLPGHGRPLALDHAAMRAALDACIAWMESRA